MHSGFVRPYAVEVRADVLLAGDGAIETARIAEPVTKVGVVGVPVLGQGDLVIYMPAFAMLVHAAGMGEAAGMGKARACRTATGKAGMRRAAKAAADMAAAAATSVAATATAAATVAATAAAATTVAAAATTAASAPTTGMRESAGRTGQHQDCDEYREMVFHGGDLLRVNRVYCIPLLRRRDGPPKTSQLFVRQAAIWLKARCEQVTLSAYDSLLFGSCQP
jgi:hypothetical protein